MYEPKQNCKWICCKTVKKGYCLKDILTFLGLDYRDDSLMIL